MTHAPHAGDPSAGSAIEGRSNLADASAAVLQVSIGDLSQQLFDLRRRVIDPRRASPSCP
jgi:hypothetical protein